MVTLLAIALPMALKIFILVVIQERKRHAELLIASLLRRVPELRNRGAKPDTAAAVGRLAFCRDIVPPSLLMEVCFLSNPSDLRLLQTRRRDFAIGLADGLQLWLRDVSGSNTNPYAHAAHHTHPSAHARHLGPTTHTHSYPHFSRR
jgi:hypothetical protein